MTGRFTRLCTSLVIESSWQKGYRKKVVFLNQAKEILLGSSLEIKTVGKVVLEYITSDGQRRRKAIRRRVKQLDLSSLNIVTIDLTPLRDCPVLVELDLTNNNLKEIDLSPLRRIKKLQEIKLRDNQFSKIDLSPLFFCDSLSILRLESEIDTLIHPISRKASSKCYDLMDMQITQMVDYTELVKN